MTIQTKTSVLTGVGSYLPSRIMTNDELATIVDTSDEWITQRSGIKERRIAAKDETTSDMGTHAAQAALSYAGIKAADIDGVIVATTTPDTTFPSVAVRIQHNLGIPPGLAFDVQAVCSGFVYALSVADCMIRGGNAKRILVVASEKMSSLLNWEDRTTCVLFGDGAGAVILEANDTHDGRGVLSTHLYADGSLSGILYTDGGPATTATTGHIVMHGKDVFRHAVEKMADVVQKTLDANGITAADIDWLVPHQANTRIIESTAKKLSLPMAQVVLTVAKHGNTSAASIPLALDEAMRDGRIKQGDLVMLEALGGGLTWGSALIRL